VNLIFLSSSEAGLRWFRRYYDQVFPAGKPNGLEMFREARTLLVDHPFAGHPYEDYEDIRELSIRRTPFTIVYKIADETIRVIDIRDARGLRGALPLNPDPKEDDP